MIKLCVPALIMMVGCASPSSLTPERCGDAPTQEQAEKAVSYFIQNGNLKDPASALVRNVRVSGMGAIINIHGNFYGWKVLFELNAKNSYGGYTGFQLRSVMVNNGRCAWVNF